MPRWRILIVDDEDDIRSIVRGTLSARYEVVEAYDGVDALAKLELAEPDFVVLDVMMPLMDGYETCEAIRKHPRFRHLSVLFLSALNSREDMMKGYSAGANLYLTKPFDPSRLLRNVDLFFETSPPPVTRKRYTLEQLRELEKGGARSIAQAQASVPPALEPPERRPPAAPPASGPPPASAPSPAHAPSPAPDSSAAAPVPRVLAVDDDPDLLRIVRGILEPDFEVFTATNGIEGIEKITSYQPDLIILDAMMPKMSGYQLCQSLRRNARFQKTPVLFVSGKATPRDREYARRIGATDFLGKPFDPPELYVRLQGLMNMPGFEVHPKSLTRQQITEIENGRKKELEEREDRLHRKEETELEKFLRENT